ncbi:MAG: peptide deformylase, partial [Arthrobacter sp.]|nr:peptide deformylase [Arthrobacter sp.]
MNPEPPPTSNSSAQIREMVHELLSSDALPAIVQAGHPALRQRSAPFEGQLDAAELSALIGVM